MQNPDGTAASAAQQQQRETSESIALLREAVLQHAVRTAPTAAPTSRLTKLGPDDDVDAYLHVVAQQASQDLPAEAARNASMTGGSMFGELYGHSCTDTGSLGRGTQPNHRHHPAAAPAGRPTRAGPPPSRHRG